MKNRDTSGIGFKNVPIFVFLVLISLGFWWGPKKAEDKLAALDASSIKMVDDFNDAQEPNLIGGMQSVSSSSKSGFVRTGFDKTDTHDKVGYSVKLEYYAPKSEQARWAMGLNELDISKAKGLYFWVKGAKGAEGFELELKDKKGGTSKRGTSIKVKASKKWQRVNISGENLASADFNCLSSLDFIFAGLRRQGEGSKASGIVYIDDIAFYGDKEVFFESLKDNIYGFPKEATVNAKEVLRKSDDELLRELAKATWGYFRDCVDKRNGLVLDHIDVSPERKIGDFTSPTNIGLHIMCVVSAHDLGFISKDEAVKSISQTLATIEGLPKWEGFLYNFYSTTNLQISRHYISSVDNGWLAAGLIVLRQAFPGEFNRRATRLLDDMKFSKLYNQPLGQLSLGYEADNKKYSPYNYGLLATEPRLTSLIAIGKGDIPREHWFRIYRTLPADWDWQDQIPEGATHEYEGIKVFEGYYKYGDAKFVPSWGGSLFEFLMPTLLVDEKNLAKDSLGKNDEIAVSVHIEHAKEKRYPVWGMSPCSTPDGSYGGYSEFGVAALGTKGYKDEGVITPHASILALDFSAEEVVKNIRKMLELYHIYGEYGLYDSVNILQNKVSYRYMALDQGMILVALNNHLNKGIMRTRFHQDPIGQKSESLLSVENFFK